MKSYSASKQAVLEGSKNVAGGVNSNFRYGQPPNPLVFRKATASELVDLDGNKYIDFYLGMGAMLLGHSPRSVIKAAQNQLEKSILVAGQTKLEYEAAKLLSEIVPSAKLVRFASSGTEAIHAAFRMSRAYTNRLKIIKFEGHYHGWTDNSYLSVAPDLSVAGPSDEPNAVPGSLGQERSENIVVLRWNDIASLERTLASEDIAAVITEPIMFNNGGIAPLPGYLEKMRELTTRFGTVLIFDEVITGFRVSAGGAQSALGITPDLTILGKALANGFPVAAVVGKSELFELVSSGKVLHGGTYNSQSVSMAATVATLKEIKSGRPYRHIDALAVMLKTGLAEILDKTKISYDINGYSAVFQMRFESQNPTDYRSDLTTNKSLYIQFAGLLLEEGIRVLPRGTWFLSAAHTEKDIQQTLKAVKRAVARLENK